MSTGVGRVVLLPKEEAERLVREGMATVAEARPGDPLYDYVSSMAKKGKWIRTDGGYVQASAVLNQWLHQENLRRTMEIRRKREEEWKKEREEAERNQALINAGLHPIYSRIPGKREYKVENGYIYERYYLEGGAWTDWKPIKQVIPGVDYYLLPGKGIYSTVEILAMAKNGTLSVQDLLNLPKNLVAEIVKHGYRQLMGMNEEIWKALKETYDPDELETLRKQIASENANLKELFQQVMVYLSKKAAIGDITAEDRELLSELAKRLMNPRDIVEFFSLDEAHLYKHNLAGVQPTTAEGNWLLETLGNIKNWVEGAANSFDNWIVNTFNVKQPVDYLADGINTILTVFGLKPLESQDREYLEQISHLAGIGTYSELVTSIIGALLGWKIADMAAAAGVRMMPKAMELLEKVGVPKPVNQLWMKLAGAGAGLVAGAQLGEPFSWMALNVRNQAQSVLKSMDTQENIAKDRKYDEVRSKLVALGEYIDLIKSAYYQKDWNTMSSTLSEAYGLLNSTAAYIDANASHLNELGVYDELKALVSTYKSVINGYVNLVESKGVSLPALSTAANSTRASILAMDNAYRIKEENPYLDWDNLDIVQQYLNWMNAINYGRNTLVSASHTIDVDTLGTGRAVIGTLPMSHADRIELVRTLINTKDREATEVKPKSVASYVAPTKDYSYYKAMLSDWTKMGLYKGVLGVLPDWVKSVVNMSYKFYWEGKERGYWTPWEMLSLVVVMLLTGLDLNMLQYLFEKYGKKQ